MKENNREERGFELDENGFSSGKKENEMYTHAKKGKR